MDITKEEFIWSEKYRPKTVDDCILPKIIKQKISGVIKTGDMQNMLFYGSPGTGKTTTARAICEQLGLEYIIINGSREGRLIETVRTTVSHFANTMSVLGNDKYKVVIYDEFDNAGEVQMAIRGLMDEVSSCCRFIFTGNYVTKIIDPIQSRTTMIDFSIPKNERKHILGLIFSRCCDILENEKIEYDRDVLVKFIVKIFPDFRKILNELQSYSVVGKIDEGLLSIVTTKYETLVENILSKNFNACKEWSRSNSYDSSIYSLIVKHMEGKINPEQWLEILLESDKYQYRHNFATDPEITLWAFCVSCMFLLK